MDENKNIENLKKDLNVLKGKIATFEEKKESLIKKRDEEINKVIYERKTEIENTYGELLTEAEKRLDVAKYEKEKERKKNIESLIKKNTKEVKDNIFYLKNEIKRILKDNKLPFFVNSEFYFTFWSPYNIFQVLKAIIVNLLIIIIPTFLMFYVYKEKFADMNIVIKVFVIGLIYAVIIMFFAGVWLIVDKLTKSNKNVLKEIIELRKNIKDSEKEIQKTTKKITKNTKDIEFDYTKLDRTIESTEIEVKELKDKKRTALTNFTTKEQDEIINKITKKIEPEITKVNEEIDKTNEELKTKQKEYNELKINSLNEENGNTI